MVSTRWTRQSNRRLLSQRDDFERVNINDTAVSDRQENVVVNEGFGNQKFTPNDTSIKLTANGNLVERKTLERCFDERIDKEMDNFVDTVEDRIQKAIDSSFNPKVELTVWSKNVSSGRDANSVKANSELRTWGMCRDYCLF